MESASVEQRNCTQPGDLFHGNEFFRRLGREQYVAPHLLFGYPAGFGRVRNLLFNERRQDITRATAFTVMPCSATSSATVLVRPAMPCLAAT